MSRQNSSTREPKTSGRLSGLARLPGRPARNSRNCGRTLRWHQMQRRSSGIESRKQIVSRSRSASSSSLRTASGTCTLYQMRTSVRLVSIAGTANTSLSPM